MEQTIDTHLMLEGSIDLTTNCRVIVTHNQFLTRNISHTKCCGDSRKRRDAAREKQETSREKRDSYREKRDKR